MMGDNRRIIGTGQEGIQVFEIETQENSLLIPSSHVDELGMSDDGSMIASAGFDGFVRVWEVATGRLLHEIALGDTRVWNVEFADDSHLLIVPDGGPVLVMTIDTEELLQIARDRLTRGFTPAECSKYQIDPCPDLTDIRGSREANH
jgi:WD40 repeat protein